MRIFNKCNLAPALFAILCCLYLNFASADDLIVQSSQNPLQFQPSQNSQRNQNAQQDLPASVANAPVFRSGPTFGAVPTPVSTDPSDVIADNVLQFGHNIGLQLAQLNPHSARTEIFSPLSVMSALSLLTLGARGKSYQQLKTILGFDQSPELANNPSKFHEEFGAMLNDVQHFDTNNANNLNGQRKHAKWRDTEMKTNPRNVARQSNAVEHTINVSNGVFIQDGYSLNPNYGQIVKAIYESEITQLDFVRRSREARDYINNWVNSSTRGKIPSIITDDIDKSTNIILASVLYFKGFWETPFFPRSTTEDNFYPDGVQNAPIRVRMMATGGVFPFYDAKEYDCRIIGLPYHGNETTMYVIQPNDSSREKLRNLQNVLNAQKINAMIDNMAWKTTIMVFPKMHFTRTMNMKTMLQSLGLHDIFQQGYSDLSLISGMTPTVSAPRPLQQQTEERLENVFGPQVLAANPKQRPLKQEYNDRFNEPALIFKSRFGNTDMDADSKTEENSDTANNEKKPTNCSYFAHHLNKRQVPFSQINSRNAEALANLDRDRFKTDIMRADLFVGDILHKVDFAVDEHGTEAAAATLSYLLRSGTDVVFRGDSPFLVVIRHDPTKLPLFYGVINKPEL